MNERMSPPVSDSDIIWLAIKRLEAVAVKMQKLEYDEELDKLMNLASEWFDWAAFNIARRNGQPEMPVDADPFERAAIIAETLMSGNEPADPETIAEAIRAWGRQSRKTNPVVSETLKEEIRNGL